MPVYQVCALAWRKDLRTGKTENHFRRADFHFSWPASENLLDLQQDA
jgi:hypothetical protein